MNKPEHSGCCGGSHATPKSGESASAIDPVCGMTVDPQETELKFTYQGQTFYFCSAHCLHKFEANPESLLSGRAASKSASVSSLDFGMDSGLHTCPMHLEIQQEGPGTCPLCGMALEPMTITLEDKPDPELQEMSRRFRVCAVLAAIVVLTAMSEHLPGLLSSFWLSGRLSAQVIQWIGFALSTPVVLWGGWPFFQRGWASIVNRHLNMFTLIAIGTGVAYFYSVIATLAPDWFPASFRDAQGTVGVYFEAAAAITALVLLGQVLELKARQQTSGAIKQLLGLAPKTARLVGDDGTEADIPLEEVQPGQRLRVRPGEKVRWMARFWRGIVRWMSR